MRTATSQKSSVTPSIPQPTVYVVDDDDGMRKSLRWLIATLGVPVEMFPSAASFLDAYIPDGPSCLVVDVLMPAMTGLELQQELRRRGDQIPVIVLTAYGNVPTAVDALKHGAIEFLEKPFDSNFLLARIRQALDEDTRRHDERKEFRVVRQRLDRLTARQSEVLGLVVQGLSSKEIAERLYVSFKTVEAHRLAIMTTMEARSVAELVRTVVGISPGP
jgi:two-component system, LuxR family, response regulator FixJ